MIERHRRRWTGTHQRRAILVQLQSPQDQVRPVQKAVSHGIVSCTNIQPILARIPSHDEVRRLHTLPFEDQVDQTQHRFTAYQQVMTVNNSLQGHILCSPPPIPLYNSSA